MKIVGLIGCLASLLTLSSGENIKVGAMYGEFTHINDIFKEILTDAAEHINRDGTILPRGDQISVVHFHSATETGWYRDSISVGVRASCSFINNKDAHALILPDDVCLNCQGLGYIMGDAYFPTIATDQAEGSGAIKMYPITEEMIELVSGVIKNYHWTTFVLLYDQDTGYTMVEELMNMSPETGWIVTPMVIDLDDPQAQMKALKEMPVKNIVVYMHVEENLKVIVDNAYEEGLLFDGWHWLFGNPNVAYLGKTFLETKLRYNSAFLTRFKMEMASSVGGNYFTRRPTAIRKWPYREQLTYDSLLAMGHTLYAYKQDHTYYPPSGRCGSGKSKLLPYFSKFSFEGCSGEVAFDSHGNRVNYTITIYVGKDQYLSISKLGLFTQNIHHWEEKKGTRWPGKPGKRLYMQPYRMAEESHIHILSIEEPPFLMRHDYELIRDPRRYRRETLVDLDSTYIGYIPELLRQIKKVFEEDLDLDFTYRLELLGEGNYGQYDQSTREWDGMMRDLYDGDADIIAAALTKTNIREQFIDYTSVWFKSTVKLLVKHPTYVYQHPFVLTFPFNIYAWMTNFVAFVVATILMWLISRLSRSEWRAKSERGEVSEEVGNTFSLYNTIYYMLSIMAFQGYPKAPNSVSARVLTAFWFAYTLMLIWLYVVQISPLVKANKTPYKIRSLFDLNKQEQFEFGVVRRSPTADLLNQATKGDKRTTWTDIQTGDEAKIVQDLIDGVRKVRRDNGRYGLLSESKMLDYEALRWPCDMLIVGGYVTIIKFPLAVQSGSPLRDQLTYAIKKLKKKGILANITSQTFHKPYCKNIYKRLWHKETKKSITGRDLAGAYYLMLLGFASTLIMFTIETVYFYLKGGGLRQIPEMVRRGSRTFERAGAAFRRSDRDPIRGTEMSAGRGIGSADVAPPRDQRDWL
ncbi:glutamate receptor 2-like [Diadema antillarum]|uniref:glutamate receptor 2-like n=1 Tax=Diadema antillarum TaxID=105358 RepID=UPI003A891AE5